MRIDDIVPLLRRYATLPRAVFATSLLLTLLTIALFLLQLQLEYAFRPAAQQYPGSSLAEQRFVSFSPENIDSGPSTSIFAVAAFSIITCSAGIAWNVADWWKFRNITVKKLGVLTCITSGANTILGMGFLVYVNVAEGKNKLPEHQIFWQQTSFTREFYVCKAFPNVFENAEALYGFPACDVAKAARYELVVIVLVSILLAYLSVLGVREKWNTWRVEINKWDIEMNGMKSLDTGVSKLSAPKKGNVADEVPEQEPTGSRSSTNSTIQKPLAAAQVKRSSLYGYYARL